MCDTVYFVCSRQCIKCSDLSTPYFFQLQKVKAEIDELSKNPHALLLEAIHSAGYSGALAIPLLAPEAGLDRLDGTILKEFVTVRP